MSENSVGNAAVLAASSGRGHRCVGINALIAFGKELGTRKAWIDIVETFEISNGLEIPRIELSIYGDHGAYDLPARERQELAADRLAEMLAALEMESAEFCFDVWLDREG